MKRLYFFFAATLCMSVMSAAASAQATFNVATGVSTTWSSASTWTIAGGTDADGIPDSDDTVLLDNTDRAGSYTITVSGTGNACLQLQVGYTGSTSTISLLLSGGSGTADALQIGNGTGFDLSIRDGGVVNNSSVVSGGGNRGFEFTSSSSTWEMTGTGKYIHNQAGGSFPNAASGNIATPTFALTSTFEIQNNTNWNSGTGSFAYLKTYGGNLVVNTGNAFSVAVNLGSGNTLTIIGDFTVKGSSNYRHNSTGAISVTTSIAGNVSIESGSTFNGATTGIGGTINVTGNVATAGTGVVAAATSSGSGTFKIGGNLDGSYKAGATSTDVLEFNGSATSTFTPAAGSTFQSLTINKSANGVNLTGSITVNVALTLAGGDLVTGANTLTMPVAATSAGTTDVVGNVLRTGFVSGGIALSFGNPFNTIAVTSGTAPANILVNLVKGTPDGFANAIRRTYTITASASGFTGTLRLHYSHANSGFELNGNNEADLVLWRKDVSTWGNQGGTVTIDGVGDNNYVELAGVPEFSPWTIAGPSVPTAVKLARFNAASYADGVQLSWESGYEVNNLGYHLYREQKGQRARVTPAVVAGSALTVGPGSRLTAGYSYSWFDQKGTVDTAYYLEAIDLNGTRQWTGPIYPYAGTSKSVSPRQARALLLSELAAASTANSVISQFLSGSLSNFEAWPTAMKDSARSETIKVSPAGLAVQQAIAGGNAVKIQVNRTGWYRLSQPELVAAGFDPWSDARLLQLHVDGAEVPIELSGNGARLNANDTLEFYGVALDTPTTDTRTYWLVNGSSAGKRISAKRGKVKPGEQNWTDGATMGSFLYTTERREKLLYSSHLLNGDADNIFGAPVLSEPINQTLTVSKLDRDSSSQPRLEVELQGLTDQGHEVQVQLNGADVGTITFTGVEHPVAKFNVNRALLRDGENQVSLVAINGDSDISFVDSIRLTYAHQYRADNNALGFSVPGGQPVRVSGFTSPNIRVLDVTNPSAPLEVATTTGPSQGGYAVTVQTSGNEVRTMVAFTDDLARHPASLRANNPSRWHSSANGANLVIITHQDFAQAIEPLAALRRSQGLRVAVVDVEDVYDEFSYGAHTPAALKDFLSRAANNWRRKPEYLLLVGDSSWDPRNYLEQGANDFVPTKLIDTSYLETGSDDWLADFSGMGMASLAIGRLPGRTAGEISLMVSKILSYEQERELQVPLRGAVMVADNGFESESAHTRALLPSKVAVQTINRSDVGNDDLMRGQIVDALNQGPMIVNYYGHGSVGVWTGAGLLDVDSAASLTNTNRLSLYVMMTCLNGYAHDAFVDSLSESALKAQNGGAVAVWASSGFTDSQPQFVMNSAFYRLLFGASGSAPLRLGEATRRAKAAISDRDVRRTWTLLGDPAMRLRQWEVRGRR